jgi:hypothetical protein
MEAARCRCTLGQRFAKILMSVELREGRVPCFERLTICGELLMNALNPFDIARTLSHADEDELKRLDYGLRTNKPIGHDRGAVAHLIELQLARADGMAVRITDLGYQVLQHLS